MFLSYCCLREHFGSRTSSGIRYWVLVLSLPSRASGDDNSMAEAVSPVAEALEATENVAQ